VRSCRGLQTGDTLLHRVLTQAPSDAAPGGHTRGSGDTVTAYISTTIVDSLEPVVGRPAAEICLRTCSGALGKPAEQIDLVDMPFVAEMIRESLGKIAAPSRLDEAITDIRTKVAQ
jgi:hypothetical protein